MWKMMYQHPRALQLLVKRCACRSVRVKLLSNHDLLQLSCQMEEKKNVTLYGLTFHLGVKPCNKISLTITAWKNSLI